MENDTAIKVVHFCKSMRFAPKNGPFREADYIKEFQKICKPEDQRELFEFIVTHSLPISKVTEIRKQLGLKRQYMVTKKVLHLQQKLREVQASISENERKNNNMKESLEKKGIKLTETVKLKNELRSKCFLINCKKQDALFDIEACENLCQPVQNSSFSSMNSTEQTVVSGDIDKDWSVSSIKAELSEEDTKVAILDCISKLKEFHKLPSTEAEYEEKSVDEYIMKKLQCAVADVTKVWDVFQQLQEEAVTNSVEVSTNYRKVIKSNHFNANKRLHDLQTEYLEFKENMAKLQNNLKSLEEDFGSVKQKAVKMMNDQCARNFIKAPLEEDVTHLVDVLLQYNQLVLEEQRICAEYPDPEKRLRELRDKIATDPEIIYKNLNSLAVGFQDSADKILQNTSYICSQLQDMQIDIIHGLDGYHPENVESDAMVSVLKDLENFIHQEVSEFVTFPLKYANGIFFPSDIKRNSLINPVTLTIEIPSSLKTKKVLNFVNVLQRSSALDNVLSLLSLLIYKSILAKHQYTSSFSSDLNFLLEEEESLIQILSSIESRQITYADTLTAYKQLEKKIDFWFEQPLRHAVSDSLVIKGRTFETFKNLAGRFMI